AVTVTKADQAISFDLSGRDTTSGHVTLSVTSTSGLPVAYSLVSGPATLSGNVLTITGVGTVVVKAGQIGNADYNPAPDVTRSFTVQGVTVCGVAFKDFNEDGNVDY